MSFAALSTAIIARGRVESIASKLSNPAYFTSAGMPSGHPTSFSYSVATYPEDIEPTEITNGRVGTVGAVEVYNYKNSCLINRGIYMNKFFDGNQYDTDGNGAALEAEIMKDSFSSINYKINDAVLGLAEVAVNGANGVLLNPFESASPDGDAPRYCKLPVEDVIDASGKFGMELLETVLTAIARISNKRENLGITGLKLVVDPIMFQNLILAKIVVQNPNSELFGAVTGTMTSFGVEVISTPQVKTAGAKKFNMLVTSDTFAFYMYEQDPISTYKQQSGGYRPGIGYTQAVKFGCNIADPNKLVVIKTDANNVVSAGALKVNDVSTGA